MLRTNKVFCCHRNEIIARLKEDFGYETRLPLTGPIRVQCVIDCDSVCVSTLSCVRQRVTIRHLTNDQISQGIILKYQT